MLSFDWRWATVGQQVLLHDDTRADSPLVRGEVAFIERRRQGTAVGIRVHDGGPDTVLWPAPQQVHLDPRDPSDECWRCDRTAVQA